MKKSRLKSRFTAFTMATVLCMVSVPVTTVNVNAKKVQPKKIVLEAKKETVAKGCTVKLSVKKMLPKGASGKIKWTSSNKRIATVNKKGVVKGKNIGKAVITASVGKAKAKCKITVYKPAKKIKLTSASSYTAKVGDTIKVSAKVISPKKGAEPIKWTSGNEAIATVNKKGVVTCKSPGTAVIKGTSGKKSVRVVVTVQAQTNANTGTPATPSAPGQPAAPSTPSKPTEPTTPETPTNPEEPTTKPEEPTEPAEPGEVGADDDILVSETSNSIKWTIRQNGLLTVEGTGDYEPEIIDNDDYSSRPIQTAPWCDYYGIITSAKVSVTNITSMQGMFFNCYRLKSIDFSGSDTSQVTDISYMFYEASNLSVVDLSACDFGNVTNAEWAIAYARDIEKIRTPLHLKEDIELWYEYTWVEEGDTSGTSYKCFPKNLDKSITLIAHDPDEGNPENPKVEETGQSGDITWTFYENGLLTLEGNGDYELTESTEEDLSGTITAWAKYGYSITSVKMDVTDITSLDYLLDRCWAVQQIDFSGSDFSKVTSAENIFASTLYNQDTYLFLIKCPKGVSIDIPLPKGKGFGWYNEADRSEPFYTSFPKNLTESITLREAEVEEFPDDENLLVEGKSGDLNWNIDRNGKLTITGTGDYEPIDIDVYNSSLGGSYPEKDVPEWMRYASSIQSATIGVNGITSTKNMFKNCTSLKSINLSGLDTSKVTDMSGMFDSCVSLVKADVSGFDTSKVTNMASMFSSCSLLSPDVSGFDTSNVTNMDRMFASCKALNLDVSGFDTSNVTNMSFMLYGNDYTAVDVSHFVTDKVTDMSYMFGYDRKLKSLDLSNFDTSNVTDMEGMFYESRSIEELNLSGFDTSKVINVGDMFRGCESLKKLDMSGCDFSKLDFSYDVGMEDIDTFGLGSCILLEEIKCPLNLVCTNEYNPERQYSLPKIEGKVWVDNDNNMYTSIPEGLKTSLSLNSIDSDKYTIASGISNEISWKLLGNGELTITGQGDYEKEYEEESNNYYSPWKKYANFITKANVQVESMTDAGNMFASCQYLKEVDLSGLNTSMITNMSGMFSGCFALEELDISTFDTSHVENMSYMFSGCSALKKLNVNGFNTAKVTNMESMFSSCRSLETLDLDNFDTSNVTTMYNMFYGCSALKSLDLSKFNTEYVNSMSMMFYDCSSLQTLDISGFTFIDSYWGPDLWNTLDSLKEIICPAGVTIDIKLPTSGKSLGWMREDKTGDLYVTLPKNLDESIKIVPVYEISEDMEIASGKSNNVTWNITGTTLTISGEGDLEQNYGSPTIPWQTYASLITSVKIDTKNMTNGQYLFSGLGKVENIDLTQFDVGNMTNMSAMFSGCSSLQSINLSNFDSKNVTDMSNMFSSCSSLKTLDLSKLNTENVTNMSYMFSSCTSLISLDLSHLNTDKVTNMSGLISGCSKLSDVNWSGINTSNVTDMSWTFSSCQSLGILDMSGFDLNNLTSADAIFNYNFFREIKTPLNVSIDIPLDGVWTGSDGDIYTSLPKNKVESITLTRGYQ